MSWVVAWMDTELTVNEVQAIWEESNVNLSGQRIILCYLKSCFGSQVKIPLSSEFINVNRSQSNVGNYSFVDPICEDIEINGKRLFYWTKPLLKTLESSISTRIYGYDSGDKTDKAVDSVDLVIGGDHGQSCFRMVVKVILRKEDLTIIDTIINKIAHIDCKKDTYEVLQQTICPAINNDINDLIDGNKQLIIYREKTNGKLYYTCQFGSNNDTTSFLCPINNNTVEEFEFVKACKVRILLTGDLAFYAAMLGKINASGHWCTWCQSIYEVWKEYGHAKGDT